MSAVIDQAAKKLLDFFLVPRTVTLLDSPSKIQAAIAYAADEPVNWEDADELATLAALDESVFSKVVTRAREHSNKPAPLLRAEEFVSSGSAEMIPTLPRQEEAGDDRVTRGSALALVGGLGSYAVAPALGASFQSGTADEIMALGFGAAIGLIGSIKRSPAACDGSLASEEVWESGKGGVAGFGIGVGVASLTQAALFSVVDGGVLLAGTLIGGGATYLYRRSKKRKLCPGLRGERHWGDCSQRVCRECYALFVPDPQMENLDCRNRRILNWYQVASHLQYQGLSYLDSVNLVRDNLGAWQTLTDHDGTILVSCRSFVDWIDQNQTRVASYIRSGRHSSVLEADRELSRQGL